MRIYRTVGSNHTFYHFYIASAVLINPIFKIALGRELWNVVDVIWAVVLLASLFFGKEVKGEEN
jgi:hypothetical protein